MVLFVLYHGRAALVDLFIVVLIAKQIFGTDDIGKDSGAGDLTGINSQQQLL